MVTWLSNLRNRSVAVRAKLLAVALLAALGVTAPVAVHLGGIMALAAAAIAAMLCLAGAETALVLVDHLRTPSGALPALWLGMTVRMGLPLAAGLLIHLHNGPLAQAGLLWYVLWFYPIALTVGTILSLPPSKRQPTPAR
jgi:hypothetical protein